MFKKILTTTFTLALTLSLASCSLMEAVDEVMDEATAAEAIVGAENEVETETVETEGDAASDEASEEVEVEAEAVDYESVAGAYAIYTMHANGETYSLTQLSVLQINGESFYIILNDDGTGRFCAEGDEVTVTYDDINIYPDDGWGGSLFVTDEGFAKYRVTDGVLLMVYDDGTVLTFQKIGTTTNSDDASESKDTEIAGSENSLSSTVTASTVMFSLYAMELDGVYYNSDAILAMGIADDYSLILNDDGTGALYIFGDTYDITWDDENIYDEGEPIPYYLDGGIMTIEMDSDTIVYLQSDIAENDDSDGTVSDNELSAFDEALNSGDVYAYYVIYELEVDGDVTSNDMVKQGGLDELYYLKLNNDGTGVMVVFETTYTITWDDDFLYDSNGTPLAYTVDGDILTFYISDSTILYFIESEWVEAGSNA